MDQEMVESRDQAPWRRPAPAARRLTRLFYIWRDPGAVFFISLLAALPFLLAAGLAPALLSLTPTMELIAPVAAARALLEGSSSVQTDAAPFYSFLLLGGDVFADAPGRIHLVAKMIAALLVAAPLAFFASTRFPALQAVLLTAIVSAYVAAPFSAASEIALAIFISVSLCFISPPATKSVARARLEGATSGALLFMLWMLSPVFSLASFIALSACPFIGGRSGIVRYGFAMGGFIILAGLSEIAAPGLNLARADAASFLTDGFEMIGAKNIAGIAGVAASAAVVIFLSAVFGGAAHARGWGGAAIFLLVAFGASVADGASAWPIFITAAALACFSTRSPFYDGVFRDHDRASIAVAGGAAALTIFWGVAFCCQIAGQFALQHEVAKAAPDNIRAELALVQPGGPTIAQWVEEGRFSTPEARALFSLAPVDQSAMLLAAAEQAREMTRDGYDVAILTGADAACILLEKKSCYADGAAAAGEATAVLTPRLDLDPSSIRAKGNAEALLYTEFRLVRQSPFWDVWVRRGAPSPSDLTASLAASDVD